MRLLLAECRRLTKRRFTRYMVLIGVLVLLAVAGGMYTQNHKIGPAEMASAQRQADREYQQQLAMFQRYQDECRAQQRSGNVDKQRFPGDCEEMEPPPKESIKAKWFLPPTFDFRQSFPDMVVVFTAILALVAFVVGASYIGAEWSSGGMTNLLLWRPRRLQVLFTKLTALVGGAVLGAVGLGAGWTALFWWIARQRGTTEKVTDGVWRSLALTGARGLALIVVAAVVGFTVASIGRHTAMALGGAIAVIVVGQIGLGIVLELLRVRFLEMWLLPTYGYAWMAKKTVLYDYRACEVSTTGECQPGTLEITWQHSAWLFGVATLVLLVLAGWSMRRRDIT